MRILAPPVAISGYVECRLGTDLPDQPNPLMRFQVLNGCGHRQQMSLTPWEGLDQQQAARSKVMTGRYDVSILRALAPSDRLITPPRGGLWEWRSRGIDNYDPTPSIAALTLHDLPTLNAYGAEVFGVYTVWFGSGMNRLACLLRWPDMTALQRGERALQTSVETAAVRDTERRALGRPLLRGADSLLMRRHEG